MNEREKIEILRTLRVIARNASNEIRQDCLEVVKGLIGGLSLSVHLLEWPLTENYYDDEGGFAPNKIQAIKALREAGERIGRPLRLREAKDLAEAYPCAVFQNLSTYSAELAAVVLTKCGCKVEIRG